MKRYTVREMLNVDGSRRVVIFQKEDGRFSFREERRVNSDGEALWGPLWNPTPPSYPTEEEAERGALDTIPWLAATVVPRKA
jgi:hypothetical protein